MVASIAVMLSACASGYTLISPGIVLVDDLQVSAGPGWNRVPDSELPWARSNTQVWTQNGISLDRLVLIPGIAAGDGIYRPDDITDYPAFRADMTDTELVELVARTIEMAQGANRTEVTTGNLRPQQFAGTPGILFDLQATVHDGPAYLGTAGAFVTERRLFLVYFLGASPWYNEQLSAAALATVVSARH